MNRKSMALCVALGALPMAAFGQTGERFGPDVGERELSLAGTGGSDKNFDSGSFGISGDIGWYLWPNTSLGIRQSVNYASIEGESITDDFWNGSTRGYANYHFGQGHWRAKPFLGASLGAVYGDGIDDTGAAGLELGMKYYVRSKTYIMGRAEYQWYFERTRDVDSSFDDGAWAYTVGLGYHF